MDAVIVLENKIKDLKGRLKRIRANEREVTKKRQSYEYYIKTCDRQLKDLNKEYVDVEEAILELQSSADQLKSIRNDQ